MAQEKYRLKKSLYITILCVCFALIAGICYMSFLTPYSRLDSPVSVNIDSDDNLDSVIAKIDTIGHRYAYCGFSTLAKHTGYGDNIRTGHYVIKPGEMTLTVFRRMKQGNQTPVRITIPQVRTVERLAEEMSKKMMMKSGELEKLLKDDQFCANLGMDTATVISIFIPNTYEFYWDTPADKFVQRMAKESKLFWTADRQRKAEAINMTPTQVVTLASIIDEETANDQEKPMVAGMYFNRLKVGMPLQADPTVKFAMRKFDAHRIYRHWLTYDSPYNTYLYPGLPPGPIRIPSVAGIEAVLNLTTHNYLYMCAKEDFSGTHNFAATYAEHQQNARRYAKALNERGIK